MRVPSENADDEAEQHFQPMPRAVTSYTNGAELAALAAAAGA